MAWRRSAHLSVSGILRIAIECWDLLAAVSGNTANPMPLSTIRQIASKLLRRTRTFNRRPVRAA